MRILVNFIQMQGGKEAIERQIETGASGTVDNTDQREKLV